MYGRPAGPGGHMDGPLPRRGGPPMDYGFDGYAQEPPMDSYRGPQHGGPQHGGGPAQQGRYPPQRQQQDPFGDAGYGPPGPPRQMRGAPRPGPIQPLVTPEFDESAANGGGMLQQGSVLMVYGLNQEKMSCQRLFNLFCLYGNVVRIKFLKSKDGVAMVQLGDNASCQRAIQNLNNVFIFGSKLMLGISKQAFIQDVPNPVDLPDGTPSFCDFMGSRNNRFSTPEAAAKNRIQPPAKALYFYNSPPGLDEDTIRKIFMEQDLKPPTNVKIFPAKSERSSTGLLEWDNKNDCIDALVMANHTQLPNPNGKNPYIMKLCFSGSPMK